MTGTEPEALPIHTLPPLSGSVSLASVLADRGRDPALPPELGPGKEKPKEGLIFVGEGLPPIPSKIVLAIEKGEFVDFSDLLPKAPVLEEQAFTEISENVIVVTQAKNVKKKRSIQDIESWLEAFCTFTAIRAKKFPSELSDLMSYGGRPSLGEQETFTGNSG